MLVKVASLSPRYSPPPRWLAVLEMTALLNNLGLLFNHQGDYAEAIEHYEQALYIAREIGSRRGEVVPLNNLGYVHHQLGDYANAGTYYEQALHASREVGYRVSEGLVLACLCLLSHHLGDDTAAHRYGQQALSGAQAIDDRRNQGYALTRLGYALAGLGRLTEAAQAYRQALDLRQEAGEHNLAIESLAGLAHVSLAKGDLTQAQAQVEEILAHLETNTLVGTDEPFRIYLTCYRVLRASQDPRAQETLDTAHRLLQEQAAKISDEKMRRLFLENVAAHREIVEEMQALE